MDLYSNLFDAHATIHFLVDMYIYIYVHCYV